MRALLLRFLRDESGRGVAEALLVTGTSLVIIPTIGEVGVKLAEVFAPAGQGAALAHSIHAHCTACPEAEALPDLIARRTAGTKKAAVAGSSFRLRCLQRYGCTPKIQLRNRPLTPFSSVYWFVPHTMPRSSVVGRGSGEAPA